MITSTAPLVDALARIALARDPQAWAVVVELLGSDLYRLAVRLTGDPALAADAVQEAFLHLRDGAGSFRPLHPDDEAGARRWALRVGANAALMIRRSRLRAQRRDERAVVADHATLPADDLIRAEEAEAVRSALAELDEPMRAVLVLHHMEGLTLPEVATSLGVPVGTVKSRLHRGSEALRRRLARVGIAASIAGLGSTLPATPTPDAAPWQRLLTHPHGPLTPPIRRGIPMLTTPWLALAVVTTLLVPAICWHTPDRSLSSSTSPRATIESVPPAPGDPVVAQPILHGRFAGELSPVLARLREEGAIDIRDHTWRVDLSRQPWVSVATPESGSTAGELLRRIAAQADLIIEEPTPGVLSVRMQEVPAWIQKALDHPITHDFAGASTDEVCRVLSEQLGVPVFIETKDNPHHELPSLWLKFQEVKATNVVHYIESLLTVRAHVSEHGVRFSLMTDEAASTPPKSPARILATESEADLLARHLQMGPAEFIRRALPDLAWGEHAPTDVPLTDGSTLVRLDTHAESDSQVDTLLRGISRCPANDPWDFIEGLHHEREQLIERWREKLKRGREAFETPITIDVQDLPFDQMIATIRKQSGLGLIISPEVARKSTSRMVTIHAEQQPLRLVLKQIRVNDATFMWTNEAIYLAPIGELPADSIAPDTTPTPPAPLALPHRPTAKSTSVHAG